MLIKELLSRAEEYASDCSDSLAWSNDMAWTGNRSIIYKEEEGSMAPLFNGNGGTVAQLTDHAFTQVAERMNAPSTKWLGNDDLCPPELRTQTMNWLFQNRDKKRLLVRGKGDGIRAVLSDKYTTFDNKEFIDLVGQAVDTLGVGATVLRPQLDDVLRAYVLLPDVTFDADPSYRGNGNGNGGLHPAVYLANSEIGGVAVKICGGLYRSFCQNGLVFGWVENAAFRMVHKYIDTDTLYNLVAAGVSEGLQMSEKIAEKFIASQRRVVERKSLRPIIDSWASKYGISVEAKDNWLGAVVGEMAHNGLQEDATVFDIVNAATYSAQHTNADEREQMERLGGELLFAELPNEHQPNG